MKKNINQLSDKEKQLLDILSEIIAYIILNKIKEERD
jgi:hypothetical protein